MKAPGVICTVAVEFEVWTTKMAAPGTPHYGNFQKYYEYLKGRVCR